MYKNNIIAVIVPAYNEELLLPITINSMPDYVDHIIIINDCSDDRTKEIMNEFVKNNPKIITIHHNENKGLGQSLIDGYLESKKTNAAITAVMAGDNQMHPDDLSNILDKIIDDNYDYVKGNRLLHQNISNMPKYRFFGNALLTILTKFATGYYFIMDPQCGYTAIKNSVLNIIPIENKMQQLLFGVKLILLMTQRHWQEDWRWEMNMAANMLLVALTANY